MHAHTCVTAIKKAKIRVNNAHVKLLSLLGNEQSCLIKSERLCVVLAGAAQQTTLALA